MAFIEKRNAKRKKPSVRWQDSRGRWRRRTAPTQRVAKELLQEVERADALGRDWQPPSSLARPLLELVMVAYRDERLRTVAAKTVEDDVASLDLFCRWCSSRVGRPAEVGDLSLALLEDYDRHLSETGHRHACAINTRRQVIGQVRRFWEWAFDQDQWEGLVPRPRKVKLPTARRARVHAATWAQVDAVIARCTHEAVRRAAVLMRFLGWRVRQVCGLVAEDLDLEAGLVHLRGELGKSALEREGRSVPMPADLQTEVRMWRLKPGERVVKMAVGSVRRAIRKAWRAAGMPEVLWRGRPDHAFRKTLRTELLATRRVDSDAIEYWCGRDTANRGRYTDPRVLELTEIARSIPPLSRHAQGAPMMRLLLGEEGLPCG